MALDKKFYDGQVDFFRKQLREVCELIGLNETQKSKILYYARQIEEYASKAATTSEVGERKEG